MSEQVVVKMDLELRKKLKIQAAKEGKKMYDLLNEAVKEFLEKKGE